MLVTRWQASMLPSKEQLELMFRLEGLKVEEETYPAHTQVKEHRHRFDEVRMVVAGELMVNVSGNKLLLRPGDRIVIPSNTRHSTSVESDQECVSLFAKKLF